MRTIRLERQQAPELFKFKLGDEVLMILGSDPGVITSGYCLLEEGRRQILYEITLSSGEVNTYREMDLEPTYERISVQNTSR